MVNTPESTKLTTPGGSTASGSEATIDTDGSSCAAALKVRISPKPKTKTLFFISMPIPEDVGRRLRVSILYAKEKPCGNGFSGGNCKFYSRLGQGNRSLTAAAL